MEIIKIVTFAGIFEVGVSGVRKITQNSKLDGAFIVFYEPKYKWKEVDVKSESILIYWG